MTNALSMQRILLALGIIVFVGAAIAGATGAFFSDTETSTGNTFAAGAIDLKIDNTSYGFDWNRPGVTSPTGVWGSNAANSWAISDLTNQLFFSFHDLKPGDYGEDTISIHVDNNDAWACMALDLTSTPDNGINGPETDAGDITDGVNGGELQNYLSFLFWNDDGDNVLETDETVIPSLSGPAGTIFSGNWLAIADSGTGQPLPGATTRYIGKGWCFGEITATPAPEAENAGGPTVGNTGFTCNGAGNHNVAQTDGIVVDVGFYAVQSRNNANFLCSSLPPLVGEAGRAVGAALGAYVAPACTHTVGVGQGITTVQGGVDVASAGQTVCVVPGTYDETVLLDEDITLASTGGPGVTAITGGINVTANGATVTGFEINPGSFLGTNAAIYLNGSLSDVRVEYNDIDGLDEAASRGVETTTGSTYTNVFIENNLIHDLVTGIYTNPMLGAGPFYIRFNDIDDNVAGIGGLNGALVVANEFGHSGVSQEAIGIDSTFDSNPASATNNNFLDGVQLNDYGAVAVMDAEDNFFNLGSAAQIDAGQFDVTPETLVMYPHN